MDNSLSINRFFDLKGMQLLEDSDLRSAKLIENFRKTDSRSWKIREGFQKWGDWLNGVTPTDLTAVDGLFYYEHQRELLAAANAAIYRETSGTFENIFTKKTAGTVSATNGSTTVTGSGTSWTELDVGKDIEIDSNKLYKVAKVASSTSLELTYAYAGNTGSGLAYTLGFDLFVLKSGKVRAAEHKHLLFFANSANEGLKYSRGRISKWGVKSPSLRPSVAIKTYAVGTVAVTNGSATVTGSGTTWDENYAGHLITIDGVLYSISKVTSTTTLELHRTYAGVTASGLSYSIEIHGSVRGRHYYRYTYVNANGQESNPSDPSNNVDVFNGQVEITVTSPNVGTDVVEIRIYRSFDQDTPPEPKVLKADDPGGRGHTDDYPGGRRFTFPTFGTQGAGPSGDAEGGLDRLGFIDAKADDDEVLQDVFGVGESAISSRSINNPLTGPATTTEVVSVRTTQVIAASPDITYHLVGKLKAHETLFTDNNTDFSLLQEVRFDNDPPLEFKGVLSYRGRAWGWRENRLYFSKAGLPEAFPVLNYLGLPNDGDEIQTAIKYQESILVFRRGDIWITEGADRPLNKVTDRGTVSPDSVIEVDNHVYFMAEDGIRVFNGMGSRELILNLREVSNPSSWFSSKAVHNKKDNEIIWTIGSKDSVVNNRMLVFNYHFGVFYMFTLQAREVLYHKDFKSFLHADDYVFVNNSDDDDGTVITWLWRGDNFILVPFGHIRLESVLVQMKQQAEASFTIKIRKNYEPPETSLTKEISLSSGSPPLWGKSLWTQFNWHTRRYIRRRVDLALTGFRHQIEISGTIKGFEFYGFEIGTRGLGNRDVA